MTKVRYGHCPDCRCIVIGGASCYTDNGQRVVACSCGSRRPPVSVVPPLTRARIR